MRSAPTSTAEVIERPASRDISPAAAILAQDDRPAVTTATALVANPELKGFAGHVSDSGEGRWTIKAAVDTGVPTPVLTASLYERFSSRGNAEFQGKLLSAMRLGFGGHVEKSAQQGGHAGE